jgi:hypothetical protein
MKHILSILALATLISSCSENASSNTQTELRLGGDFLFEGPNTLQGAVELDLVELCQSVEIAPEQVQAVRVNSVKLNAENEDATITESYLLQITSNNNELSSIGTLNPVGNSGPFELQIAEETDLLSFLQDEGATWVLDLNLTAEHMDEMMVKGTIGLTIEYKE